MPRDKPHRGQVELANMERRVRIAELYAKGYSQAEIGKLVKLERSWVSRELKAIREEWAEQAREHIAAGIGEELAKIKLVEHNAWLGWERSLKNEETKKEVTGSEKSDRKEKTSRGQAGKHQYLDIVIRCIERRCKLTGIDAPEQHQSTHTLAGGSVAILRQEILKHESIITERRTFALHVDASPVCTNGEQRQMEDGAAPGIPGPSTNGHDHNGRATPD